MIVLGTLGRRVLEGTAEEEAEVEEGRIEEDAAADEEAEADVSFHMLDVEDASREAEVLVADVEMLEVTLALALTLIELLAMLEMEAEASVRDSV
jgi:hypothetical protein